MATISPPVTMDTLISVRVNCQNVTRKFKIPLGDLTAQVLPGKLRSLLSIPDGQAVIFERYSDSAAAYVTLDPNNQHVYKTLFRAAKAKLKLRLKATVPADTISTSIPPFQPIGLPGAFASAFPEFARFGSETTLNSTSSTVRPPTIPQQPSVETLIAVTNESASPEPAPEKTEASTAEATPQSAPSKRMSPRLNRESYFAELANLSRQRDIAVTKEPVTQACSWSVFCNSCDKPMANEHYHCNICDDGDYDLCDTCVNAGIHCPGESHWLVKRFVQNGQVVNSSTERLQPKPQAPIQEAPLPEMPGAYTTEHVEEKKAEPEHEAEPEVEAEEEATRTCNCCVTEYAEDTFVTCLDCEDYDLCFTCHEANKHGHHPGHQFTAVAKDTPLSPMAEFLCAPGRNTKHHALCDGCDKPIFGIRNKCLNCPDWDYCSECIKNAPLIHPGHRFAPLYDPIAAPRYRKTRHVGIYCDGPLCENKHDYIEGVRYKCAICHDTDFCAGCEAYPHNKHNHTHPLIQFKTPIRNATITTVHEDQFGNSLAPKGDRHAPKAESSKAPTNAATQVQTIVDVKPAESPAYKPSKEKIEIKDLLAEPISEKIKVQDLLSSPIEEPKRAESVDITKLNAVFIRETVLDGSTMSAEQGFTQVWTMRNPGPEAWPAGCCVRYTGGDNMLGDVNEATTSNIIDRPVQVGEEISFRVILKAPQNAGTKISYWRLKTSDGQAFGHRLWCHIVVNAKVSAPVPSSLPQVVPQPSASTEEATHAAWQDNFLQQTLKHRLEKTRRHAMQRAEQQKFMAQREAQAVAEAEAKINRAEMLRKLSSEIHAVETQHKARIAAAKAAVDAARTAKEATAQPVSELPALPFRSGNPHLATMQAQVHALEQQNRQRMQMARDQQEAARTADAAKPFSMPTPPRNLVLQDFQMQLMLLEQQNKKHLHMARQAQDSSNAQSSTAAPAPLSDRGLEDYHEQLALLEQQNKKRMFVCRQVGDRLVCGQVQVGSDAQSSTETPALKATVAPVEVEAPVAVKEEPVVANEEPKDTEKSNMIFPKLDKESPISSIHDIASTSTVKAPGSPRSDQSDLEIFEDAESVTFAESDDEDDAFLTDEEYDILDASDEEVVGH